MEVPGELGVSEPEEIGLTSAKKGNGKRKLYILHTLKKGGLTSHTPKKERCLSSTKKWRELSL